MEELLTTKDMAKLLGVKVNTVYVRRYRNLPMPPVLRIGNFLRYRRSDVEKWLETHVITD